MSDPQESNYATCTRPGSTVERIRRTADLAAALDSIRKLLILQQFRRLLQLAG